MAIDGKTYPAPWQGQVILACRKCQKKLKGEPGLRGLAKIKKTVKRHNRQHPDRMLHVINVPCMDLCPKGGVTVCDPVESPNRLAILRSEKDVEELLSASRCVADTCLPTANVSSGGSGSAGEEAKPRSSAKRTHDSQSESNSAR